RLGRYRFRRPQGGVGIAEEDGAGIADAAEDITDIAQESEQQESSLLESNIYKWEHKSK
ncbi:MAG: hypothetical protein GY832_07650, partial [Chloroflexi bacterium]|nr:hypothetical protein [Chloroflexota bacterium]